MVPRLQAQSDELFDEKERAQVTLNSIGDAVASTDNVGNLTFLNGVAEKLSGWSRQEVIGRPSLHAAHRSPARFG